MRTRHRRLGRHVPLIGGLAAVAIALSACSGSGVATAAPSEVASNPPATAQVMGAGTLHEVDGTATGEAQLVVKPDGSYAVVLENFSIEAIAHTNLVLVSNTDVTATDDVDKAKLLDLGPLKATEGMQDFVIPADMNATVMEGYHAVVIWDTEMEHVIAAAPLG